MNRWSMATALVLLACAWVVLHRYSNPIQFADTDTRVLLEKLEQRNNPWSWFLGDWPLENHFYRPVSTLTFELDRWLHPGSASGFGLTSAFICALCVLALFWFARELTDSPALSAASAALFAAWNVDFEPSAWSFLYYAGAAVALAGLIRNRGRPMPAIAAGLAIAYLPIELLGAHRAANMPPFTTAILQWLPARTATTMTLFALLAMAAYSRFERLEARFDTRAPSPLDPPATKSSGQATGSGTGLLWLAISAVCVALALGCYEQAVMLPAVLIGVGAVLRLRGYRVRWGWHVAFWLVLAMYIVVRSALVPQSASGYQLQQFRSGPGVAISVLGYVLPAAAGLITWSASLSIGLYALLDVRTYAVPVTLLANFTAFWHARRRLALALGAWTTSLLAYLPMAWLKQSTFSHYHYWPLAIRALFVVTLAWVAWELLVIAVSPPARQAPPRPVPAPGSLPRR